MPSPLRWLFVDLNSFFASCEQQEDPGLRGRPVGVVPLMADTTSCLAASYEAKAFGIKTGTSVREARARCPQIRFVVARHEVYTRYHHAIKEAVERVIPVEEVLSIDEMVAELLGSQREPGAAWALGLRVKQTIRRDVGDCLRSSVGLAPNRYLAKVASDMQKPDGLTALYQDQLPQALFALSPQDLPGIGPRMAERLRLRGIHRMAELCALSAEEMRAIWGGVVGERFYQWLRGLDVPLKPVRHRSLGHQHVLEPALRNADGAWLVAKKLLTKAAVRLRGEHRVCRRLAAFIRFLGPEKSEWARQVRLEETADTLKLLTALRGIWPSITPRQAPLLVSITLMDFAPDHARQALLFENPLREALGPAMDRIQERHGKHALSPGALYQFKEAAPTRIAFHRIPQLDEF